MEKSYTQKRFFFVSIKSEQKIQKKNVFSQLEIFSLNHYEDSAENIFFIRIPKFQYQLSHWIQSNWTISMTRFNFYTTPSDQRTLSLPLALCMFKSCYCENICLSTYSPFTRTFSFTRSFVFLAKRDHVVLYIKK